MRRINDIFYSLQGEGYNTGRAAVFVRFSGCNLRCPFCDTDFGAARGMTDSQLVEALAAFPSHFVVLTGGEPALQADGALVDLLHSRGYEVAMETNGSRPVPGGVDWVTVSPKPGVAGWTPAVTECDELKCIFDGTGPVGCHGITARYYYLQPCDVGDTRRNRHITRRCIDYIKAHPQWRLSLQTHKLAGFK